MSFEPFRKDYIQSLSIQNHAVNHINSFDYFLNEGIHLLADGENWFDIYKDSLNED